jgi:hypothetical protein
VTSILIHTDILLFWQECVEKKLRGMSTLRREHQTATFIRYPLYHTYIFYHTFHKIRRNGIIAVPDVSQLDFFYRVARNEQRASRLLLPSDENDVTR